MILPMILPEMISEHCNPLSQCYGVESLGQSKVLGISLAMVVSQKGLIFSIGDEALNTPAASRLP